MASKAFEDIVSDMEFLDDWEDRYRHVIDLGRAMGSLEDRLKGPETKVEGCASQVWIVPTLAGTGADAVMTLRGDSDAMIVRGLIAVLIALYSGRNLAEIGKVDAGAELARIGLDQHLSAQRSNGLRAMVARIRVLAGA